MACIESCVFVCTMFCKVVEVEDAVCLLFVSTCRME